MVSEKVYWIGDNKDEKSALIGKTFYLPGDVIPGDEVESSRLKDWKDRGLVSGGVNSPPVIIKDKEEVKRLETEARELKVKLEAMPALVNQNAEMKAEIAKMSGLNHENSELKTALEKAKSGKKADKLKELEQDVAEKDALIKKQIEQIAELEKDLEDATAPAHIDEVDAGDDTVPEGGDETAPGGDETGGPQ